MKRFTAAAPFCIALALAACTAEPDAGAEQAPAAAREAQSAPGSAEPGAPTPAQPERWLLDEFDWGDSEEIVYESVQYTDGFLCYRHKLREFCAFVKTRVDGEELLAKFEFVDGRLWRIDVLTPDLNDAQASEHLERVWKLLAAYVTRFHGEAPEQAAFPPRESLAPGALHVTHRWKLADQEIRLVVGRGPGEPATWFTAARFVDPKWAKHEPAPKVDSVPSAQPATASPTS